MPSDFRPEFAGFVRALTVHEPLRVTIGTSAAGAPDKREIVEALLPAGVQDHIGLNCYSRDVVRFAPRKRRELFIERSVALSLVPSTTAWMGEIARRAALT